MNNWYERFERKPVTWTVLAIVGVVLLCWLLLMGLFGLRVATAGLVGAGSARIQIQSAGSRIAAYNHFFDLCASVQSNESRIDGLTDARAGATSDFERERLNVSLAGVHALRMEAIRDYNADARKDYTIGQFRDSDLPYQLPANEYVKGERKTSCGAD